MKILHIGDFHLDSAFSGFEKDVADQKREELRNCFAAALRKGRERGVDLVLLSGDVFDTPFCTAATRRVVFDAIATAGCPVVITPGNHDYYTKNGTYTDKALPDNAFVFTSTELGRFDFDELGVSVIGFAFTSDRYEKNPLGDEIPLSDTNINILCAHGDLGTSFSKYAPMNANEIARAGFSYAALGHVHIAPEPQKIDNSLIAYSGFAQGRSFDELGDGGAYIVDIDRESGRAELERIKLSALNYEIEKIDVTSLDNDDDVIRKIEAVVAERGYGERCALRVILSGSVPSSYSVGKARIESSPAFSRLALLQVRDNTSANFDLEYLEADMTVRGEIYRQLLPALNSADERERTKASLALKFALAALDNREIGVD